MKNIGLFTRRKQPVNETASRVQMVVDRGNGYYAWDGKIYQSDIVRACMRPKVKAVGKLVGKHIRETVSKDGKRSLTVNPEPYMRFLLEEPNPHMSGQKLQEKTCGAACFEQQRLCIDYAGRERLPDRDISNFRD